MDSEEGEESNYIFGERSRAKKGFRKRCKEVKEKMDIAVKLLELEFNKRAYGDIVTKKEIIKIIQDTDNLPNLKERIEDAFISGEKSDIISWRDRKLKGRGWGIGMSKELVINVDEAMSTLKPLYKDYKEVQKDELILLGEKLAKLKEEITEKETDIADVDNKLKMLDVTEKNFAELSEKEVTGKKQAKSLRGRRN